MEVLSILMPIVGIIVPLPQVIRALKRGNSKGVSSYFITLWLFDRVISFAYAASLHNWPFMIKYGIGIILIAVIARYKLVD